MPPPLQGGQAFFREEHAPLIRLEGDLAILPPPQLILCICSLFNEINNLLNKKLLFYFRGCVPASGVLHRLGRTHSPSSLSRLLYNSVDNLCTYHSGAVPIWKILSQEIPHLEVTLSNIQACSALPRLQTKFKMILRFN